MRRDLDRRAQWRGPGEQPLQRCNDRMGRRRRHSPIPVGQPAVLRGVLLLLLTGFLAGPIMAQERAAMKVSFSNVQSSVKIDVLVGQSRLLEFDEEYERVSISGEKVAEVIPITTRQVMINGLNFGQVNLVVWARSEPMAPPRMLVFDLNIQANLTLIDNQIKMLFPKENIQLSQANNSVVLSGTVTRPELAEQAQKIIEAAGLKVTNLLKIPILDAAQVQLQVRIAEVNRQVLRQIAPAYGIQNTRLPTYISPNGPAQFRNLPQGGGGGSLFDVTASPAINLFVGSIVGGTVIQGFLNAMYTRGALRDLAEPNLIAMHGQTANFLAGGEFPIPVVQAVTQGQSAVTIIYKEFGVKLTFTPTILDENHIRLELEPEVSSLDTTAAIQLSGFTIPGLRVRRAKTTLELRDGQSFALAGLIDNTEQANLSKFPLLGDIPLIGELFKSRSFRRNETELLFLATVRIVEPLNPDELPKLPGVSDPPSANVSPVGIPSRGIEGASGHEMPRQPETVRPPDSSPRGDEQSSLPAGTVPPQGKQETQGKQEKALDVTTSPTTLRTGVAGPGTLLGPVGQSGPTASGPSSTGTKRPE